MKNNCVFCKIIKKEIPADIVFENKDAVAFLDIKPVNPGHMLIIPKKHFPALVETPDETVKKMFVITKKLMPLLKTSLKADFVALSVVGNDVPHLHIHLIPRWSKDGLANFWPAKNIDSKNRSELAQTIKKEIDKNFGRKN